MAPTVKENSPSAGSERQGGTLRDLSEQAASAGRAAKQGLTDAASTAASVLKDQGGKLAGGAQEFAQEFASDLKEDIRDRIEDQKDSGADYLGRLADTVRLAGREFDHDLPIAAEYIGLAASTMDEYAQRIRNGDLENLIDGAKDFARRQPTAFLGLTFLAGFGLMRFLKSSSGERSSDERETSVPSRDRSRSSHY